MPQRTSAPPAREKIMHLRPAPPHPSRLHLCPVPPQPPSSTLDLQGASSPPFPLLKAAHLTHLAAFSHYPWPFVPIRIPPGRKRWRKGKRTWRGASPSKFIDSFPKSRSVLVHLVFKKSVNLWWTRVKVLCSLFLSLLISWKKKKVFSLWMLDDAPTKTSCSCCCAAPSQQGLRCSTAQITPDSACCSYDSLKKNLNVHLVVWSNMHLTLLCSFYCFSGI
jgi:hypothetical protein